MRVCFLWRPPAACAAAAAVVVQGPRGACLTCAGGGLWRAAGPNLYRFAIPPASLLFATTAVYIGGTVASWAGLA